MSLFTTAEWPTIALVLGGTLLATLLRCGFGDCRVMLRTLARGLVGRRFDAAEVRAALAVQVQDIRKDGLVRARIAHLGDREVDEATRAMIGERSVAAMLVAHEAHKLRRDRRSLIAARTLAIAAELAPVFGLFGTLVSLGKLPANGVDHGGYMAAIGMAVQATMVGLLAANLLFAPLARLVERAHEAEEAERQALFDWLAGQFAQSEPQLRDGSTSHHGSERLAAGPRAPVVHRFNAA